MRSARTLTLILAPALLAGSGCRLQRSLPWVETETIVDRDPDMLPVTLEQMNDRHVVVVRAPTGGWTLSIDKSERTPEGERVYLTARRPDPAFYQTQAIADLHALTEVPATMPIELVSRVLDHDADPKHRVYARTTPVASLD